MSSLPASLLRTPLFKSGDWGRRGERRDWIPIASHYIWLTVVILGSSLFLGHMEVNNRSPYATSSLLGHKGFSGGRAHPSKGIASAPGGWGAVGRGGDRYTTKEARFMHINHISNHFCIPGHYDVHVNRMEWDPWTAEHIGLWFQNAMLVPVTYRQQTLIMGMRER